MPINHAWTIEKMKTTDVSEERPQAVREIYWRLYSDNGEISVSAYGTQPIAHSAEVEFVPFELLTEEIVLDWAKLSMGEEKVSAIETELSSVLEGSASRVPLPWEN